MKSSTNGQPLDLFSEFKESILNIDPVSFCENNLNIEGGAFRLNGNGYKPFIEIYRYIGLKAVERNENSKPVILVKGRQVGATTMAAAIACYFMACGLFGNNGRPPMRIMHLFPTLALAAAYSRDKFEPMIGSSRPVPGEMRANGTLRSLLETKLDRSSPANNNMHFKKFLGGNQIWIESTGADGDRVRGRTVDCALFDEVQDIPGIAIGAVNKVLTKAQYGATGDGIQVYFGTPKQKGTAYYNMWKKSTQQYYHLGCENCGEYFPLYHPNVNWEDIWIYGWIVRCTNCKHEQDKNEAAERGKWIPHGDELTSDYIGYHINQLYIPDFPKEKIIKAKPEFTPTNTERIYQNEVLGEFYDGEGATISPEQIQESHENTDDMKRRFSKHIGVRDGRRVYAGFDWGQRGDWDQLSGRQRGQSYSCGVILTALEPSVFQIEFATRLQRTGLEAKMDVVEEMFRRYSVHIAIGDIGDASDLTHVLQKKYNDRFLASRAAPKVIGHIKYTKDIYPKEIVFERDYYISELMGLLKQGAIRFPYGDYEEIKWLIDHCCSMEIKITQDRSGDPKRRYVKGPTPNDGFMALLNAYLAYKFDITQGFSIHTPRFMKYDEARRKRRIPAVTGYMPRWK